MAEKNITSLLMQFEFLKRFEPEQLAKIAECASEVSFKAGKLIFREGETADSCILIRFGTVAIETSTPDRGSFSLQTIGEGEIVGWSWLFPPYCWHFDVKAVTDTKAIALDGKRLRKLCDVDQALGYLFVKKIARVIAKRLQATRLQIMDVYGAPAGKGKD